MHATITEFTINGPTSHECQYIKKIMNDIRCFRFARFVTSYAGLIICCDLSYHLAIQMHASYGYLNISHYYASSKHSHVLYMFHAYRNIIINIHMK